MSMNLHVEEEYDLLWQTPTYVTKMILCCSTWQAKLKAYEHWVNSHCTGVWKNPQELKDQIAICDDHLKKVRKVAKKHGQLTFYEM